MITRIVVADQTEARFYDAGGFQRPLQSAGGTRNASGRLRERDLVADRPGRVFDSRPAAGQRRGSAARHATGGERTARRHAQQLFARRTALQLERDLRAKRFDRLVVVAPAEFLGRMRAALTAGLRRHLVATVAKDIVHLDNDVRDSLPRDVFTRAAGFSAARRATTRSAS